MQPLFYMAMSLDEIKGKDSSKDFARHGSGKKLNYEKHSVFSTLTATIKKPPVLGLGLGPLWMPLNRFHLLSDLVCGEVSMGVCPQFPVTGVYIILGNYLAGAKVWKDDPSLLCVDSPWQQSDKLNECAMLYPKVFSSCAVTPARTKAKLEQLKVSQNKCSLSDHCLN